MKILIAGAGIGGLTAAIAMRQHGFEVEVFEQAAKLEEVGAGIQLSPNAMRVMQKLGLEQPLEKVAFEPEFAALRHYKNGNTVFKTALKSQCRTRYGAPYLHMHRADLLNILVHNANESGVKLHLNSGVEKYAQTTDSVSVTLSNGQAFTGDLLIGADGVHSVIQQQMHPGLEPTFTGQAAWRGLVPVNAVPKGLIKPGVTVWMGPQRHVVIYYVRGGQLLNFVAVEECDNWIQESWSKQGDLAALHASFYGWHPAVTQLLDACSETYLWGLFDRKPLNTWSDGRVTLLGDACHPMLPFMSQGAAMAIEDAYVLSQLVAEKHKVDNLESILESYEAQRKPRTSFIQNISTQNANIYHMSNPLTGNIKLWFAKLLNSVAPIYAQKRLDKVYGVDVTAE